MVDQGQSSEEPYRFSYSELSAYVCSARLMRTYFSAGEVVLDLGCGYGALADKCREMGLTYVGLDSDERALKDLESRGFETHSVTITGGPDFQKRITSILDGRALAGMLILDVLEHLVDAKEVLDVLRDIAVESGAVPLIICIPNVTHYDLGAKLLQGRWDETEVGILDHTHVAFYSADNLNDLTRAAGWNQIAQADFRLDASDQHFPADNVALTPGTPLNSVLRHVRNEASEGADVVQFVRAYVPGPHAPVEAVAALDEDIPFLTVLTRTQGNRLDTLQETLLCLAGQSSLDFEVLVLAHNLTPAQTERVGYLINSMSPAVSKNFRVVPVTGPGRCRPLNVGLEEARGTYVAVLDDDDLVLGNWVEVFQGLGHLWPGRVLRAMVAEQDISRGRWPDREGYQLKSGIRVPYPEEFDLFDHIVENRTPPCGLAFPRSCFRDLKLRFDESLPVLEDWDVLLQSALVCGVASSKEVTSIYRRWTVGPSSTSVHTAAEWHGAHQAVIAKLDRRASIFPSGSITRIRELQDELTDLRLRLAAAQHEVDVSKNAELATIHEWAQHSHAVKMAYESSASWKVTAPIRILSGKLRRRRQSRSTR